MTIVFHPAVPGEVRRFAAQYFEISPRLGGRFRREIDEALARIATSPTSAGHFVNTGAAIVKEIRRRNLESFPHFILYGIHAETIVIGAVIPSASDPLTWLTRFGR